MNGFRPRALLGALAIASAAAAQEPAAAGGEAESVASFEEACTLFGAFRAGITLHHVAARPELDLVDLANQLCNIRLACCAGDPSTAREVDAALVELSLAERALHRGRGVACVAEEWSRGTDAWRARELALRKLDRDLGADKDARRWSELLARARGARALEEGAGSLSMYSIRMAEGLASYHSEDYLAAAQSYAEAALFAARIDDPRGEALALYNAGMARLATGEMPAARPMLERSRRLRQSCGDRRGAAESAGMLGNVLLRMGFPDEAEASYVIAVRDLRALGDARGAANYEGQRALVYDVRGEYARAHAVLSSVLDELTRLQAGDDAALLQGNLGLIAYRLGWYPEAEERLRLALDYFESRGMLLQSVQGAGNLGLVLEAVGRYREAIASYEHALEIATRIGARNEALGMRGNIAGVHQRIGEYALALEDHRAVLAEARHLGNEIFAMHALRNLGELHGEFGRLDEARAFLRDAAEIAERMGHAETRTAIEMALGEWAESEGRLAEAALHYERAWRERLDSGDRSGAADSRLQLGDVLALTGRVDEARASFESTFDEASALGDRVRAARALLHLGWVERRLDHLPRAREHLDAALEELSAASDRPTLSLAHAYVADVEIARACWPEAALAARRSIEAGSRLARGLSDENAVGLRGTTADASYFGIRAMCEMARADAARREELLAQAFWFAESARALLLVRGLSRADAARSERGAVASPIALAEARALLSEDAAYLCYTVEEGDALALLVTRASAELVRLERPASVSSDAARYVQLASIEGTDEAALARELYARLLEPFEPSIARCRRLLISPGGALSWLPFDALRDAAGRRAIERWEIVYTPSATAHFALAARSRASRDNTEWLGVGDPLALDEGGAETGAGPAAPGPGSTLRTSDLLPRLPESGEEVREIASLFPESSRRVLVREQASVANVLAAVRNRERAWSSVHFACHGVVDGARPALSGLVLARGEVLTAAEIADARVAADLVVLSACRTAVGPERRGEGVVNLARAFFQAGALRVIVSNWRVSDASTRKLMVAFYRNWIERKLGVAAALRAAKRELAAQGGPAAHPYHWAGFVLWGAADE